MKALVCAIVLCFVLTGMVVADTPGKVTLDAKAMTLKDATDALSKQSGAAIVLDPRATGTVNASLSGADLSQALDVIAKGNNLSWKKLQFARKSDSKVSLEQLKAGVLALSSMQWTGLAVEDPATKTSAVFAKDMPSSVDATKLALPDGYVWNTVYVLLAPEPAAQASNGTDKVTALSQSAAQQMVEVANLTGDERKQYFQNMWAQQMRMAPEARQALMRDQFAAMRSLNPDDQAQLRQDMRSLFGNRGGNRQDRNQGGQRRNRAN